MSNDYDEIDDRIVVNLLASIVASLLINVQDLMPEYSKKRRLVKKVEEAVKELAKLHALHLDERTVQLGVIVWNTCMEELERALIARNASEGQLWLFPEWKDAVAFSDAHLKPVFAFPLVK